MKRILSDVKMIHSLSGTDTGYIQYLLRDSIRPQLLRMQWIAPKTGAELLGILRYGVRRDRGVGHLAASSNKSIHRMSFSNVKQPRRHLRAG